MIMQFSLYLKIKAVKYYHKVYNYSKVCKIKKGVKQILIKIDLNYILYY